MKRSTSLRRRSIVAAVAAASIAAAILTPAAANAAVPTSWIQEQVNFILSKQISSGAILSNGNKIQPYFANEGVLGLLKANTAPARSGALAWMQWYLGHLNASGPNVPANSVFDYNYDPVTGAETSTGDFDSVDSYASTTLNVAYAAYNTGDVTLQNYVSTNISTYEAIANLLDYSGTVGVRVSSGPQAGLTIAKPSYPIAYLMDNAEVYSGLHDFALLEAALGRASQSTYYQGWAATTQSAILAKLWNATNNNWDFAYGNPSTTGAFYPQAAAQPWPVMFGVVSPTDPKALAAWNQFTTWVPNWYFLPVPDAYPWASLQYAGRLMGAGTSADKGLTNIRARYAPSFTTPTFCGASPCGQWYVGEAGWFIIAGS